MKPIMTEKAVMMIERDNVLTFQTSMKETKAEIKQNVEELFGVKINKIRTLVRDNKKYAYIKLKGDTLAIDIATKLGLM
ncbi:50S ribosomal protein L23 [archaeon]|jgi:large subunit ribosomal protein L23|nr:50S ribosomal protein L23 [archaeon]